MPIQRGKAGIGLFRAGVEEAFFFELGFELFESQLEAAFSLRFHRVGDHLESSLRRVDRQPSI